MATTFNKSEMTSEELAAAIAAAEAAYASLDKYLAGPAGMAAWWWIATNCSEPLPEPAALRRAFFDARLSAAENLYNLKKEAGLYINSPGIPTSGGRDEVDLSLYAGLFAYDAQRSGAAAGAGGKVD